MSAIAILLLAASLLPAGESPPNRVWKGDKPFPLAKVKPGMRGYMRTVLRGSTIEQFDLEVIDVLPRFLPREDVVLVRVLGKSSVSGQEIEHIGILHGMSGSPVYLQDPEDGEWKCLGALAFGFSGFPKDPITGITPLETMLRERDRPLSPDPLAGGSKEPTPPSGKPGGGAGLRPLATPVFLSGFSRRAAEFLAKDLEPCGLSVVQGGAGRFDPGAKIEIEPGGSIGVQLMRGDLDASGTGTVTWRDGDSVLAFGHPMLQGGEWPMPVTSAWVHTVVADLSFAYKMSSPVAEAGSLLRDQQSAILCQLGRPTPLVPFDIHVRNSRTGWKQDYAVEVVRHPGFTTSLLMSALLSCAESAEPVTGFATVQSKIRIELEGRAEPIELQDLSALSSGIASPMMLTAVPRLLQNPFGKVEIRRIVADVEVVPERRTAEIQAAWTDVNEIEAGRDVTLTIVLRPYDRPDEKVNVTFTLPANLPEDTYEIEVGAGRTTEPDAPEPKNVEDLLRWLKGQYLSSDLLTVVELGTIGTKQEGRSLRKLPFSVFGTLLSSASAGVTIAPDTLRVVTKTGYVLAGKKTVRIKVKNPGGGQ
ncbi:MAG TPA: hypothetical protein VFI25_18420 [Planctomycetota bacterium]|jgi:hypothetical protein|nr:hypothetical protein [Planctomycetota bacterium]